MNIAIVDMGTNTFHLLITKLAEKNHEVIHKERVSVKIGEKGINKGEISPDAWERAVSTVSNFQKAIERFEVTKTFATATSAVRNASNGGALVDEIEKETGIRAEVISGEREAELILKGARNALDLGLEKNLIMDIGGGSIEFIIASQNETFWLKSFEIGGQRLVERFHKTDPVSGEEKAELIAYFDQELEELREQCRVHQPPTLVGCSGTFDTLSDIYCQSNGIIQNEGATEYPLPLNSFQEIHEQIITKKRAERLAIPGMIEMRVDMIVVASILIHYVINQLEIKNLRVSGYALKEGVLANTIESVQNTFTSDSF